MSNKVSDSIIILLLSLIYQYIINIESLSDTTGTGTKGRQ